MSASCPSFGSENMREVLKLPDGEQSEKSFDPSELGVVSNGEIIPDKLTVEKSRYRSLSPGVLRACVLLQQKGTEVKQSLVTQSSQDLEDLENVIEKNAEIEKKRGEDLRQSQLKTHSWVTNTAQPNLDDAQPNLDAIRRRDIRIKKILIIFVVCGFITYNYFSASTPDAPPEVRVVLNCTPIMSFCGDIWATEWQTCMENQKNKTRVQIEKESRECVQRVWNLTEGNATGANATGDNSSSV